MINHEDISWEDTRDPQACNGPRDEYMDRSRDPARTPFQWNSSRFSGFSTVDPWLPIHPDYETHNLALQVTAENSVYNYYRKLVALRKQKALAEGDFNFVVLSDYVFAYTRSADGQSYAIVANVGSASANVTLNELTDNFPAEIEVVLPGVNSNYESR